MKEHVKNLIEEAERKKFLNFDSFLESDEYCKVRSLVYSFKYFFIQLNDLCDLASVLGLLSILKYSKIGFFESLPETAFFNYAGMCAVETGLEIVYTVATPPLIRRFTKFKYFYPTIGGKDLLYK